MSMMLDGPLELGAAPSSAGFSDAGLEKEEPLDYGHLDLGDWPVHSTQ